MVDICQRLRELPDYIRFEHFENAVKEIQSIAIRGQIQPLLNWLNHKEQNPWLFQCLSRATTKMNYEDWSKTSFSSNLAESAHAQSQRDGKQLTLVAAIQKAQHLDNRFFISREAVRTKGVSVRYGDNSMSGLVKKNMNRSKKTADKRRQKTQDKPQEFENTLTMLGISSEYYGAYKGCQRRTREKKRVIMCWYV